MLQKMRDNTQGLITKIIIGVICLVFVVWGLETLILPHSDPTSQKVAKVNGEAVTQQQYYESLQNFQRRLLQQGVQLPAKQIQSQVLDGLIQSTVLLTHARSQGMIVTDKQIDELIVSMPVFQSNGKFDRQRYTSLLNNAGLSPISFKRDLRRQMLMGQEQIGIAGSSFVTDRQVDRFIKLEKQLRSFSWATLKKEDIMKKQQVTPKEIESFYNDHKKNYMTDEQVQVEYITLDQNDIAAQVKVNQEDMDAEYQAYIAEQKEKFKPTFSLILLKTDEKHSEKQQIKKATEIKAQLSKGEKFGTLAKKYSEDPLSSKKEGVIQESILERYGDNIKAHTEKMQPQEVSEPLVGKLGVVLLKRTDSGKPEIKPLKEIREVLVKRIQSQRAISIFADKIEKLKDISFEAADLKEPAKKMGLKIETTPFFSAKRASNKGITANRAFINAAFSEDVKQNGNNSEVINLSTKKVAVLHLKKDKAAQQKELSTVSAEIEKAIKTDKAQKFMKETSDKIVEALKAGTSIAEASKQFDITWEHKEKVKRDEKGIPRTILSALFSLPFSKEYKDISQTSLPSGDVAILVLNGIFPGDDKVTEKERENIKFSLANNRSQINYAYFSDYLYNKATIEIMEKSIPEQ